jgi:PAS domain S-box-containing protein
MIVPDDLRDEVPATLKRIREGERIDHRETVRMNKDGRLIDVSLGIAPIRSHAGTVVGVGMVVRDITARKKAQEALLDSEQMARDVIANALDAFIQTDETGTILEWNPQAEAIFGWSRQEAVGRHPTSLLLPKDVLPQFETMSERLLRNEQNAAGGARFVIDAVRKDAAAAATCSMRSCGI